MALESFQVLVVPMNHVIKLVGVFDLFKSVKIGYSAHKTVMVCCYMYMLAVTCIF